MRSSSRIRRAPKPMVSPDGSRVYVGGSFTTVDGVARNRIAAFDTATGNLVTSFYPRPYAQVTAIAATNGTVIGPERAASILLEAAQGKPEHDTWTLVENAAAQKAITKHLQEQRRRARRE